MWGSISKISVGVYFKDFVICSPFLRTQTLFSLFLRNGGEALSAAEAIHQGLEAITSRGRLRQVTFACRRAQMRMPGPGGVTPENGVLICGRQSKTILILGVKSASQYD